jgi:hypothetical protein
MLNLRAALAELPTNSGPAPHDGKEYVNGWGVFALPFASGDVLALRVFPQNDFTPYVAIWHRNPSGRWAIYVDGDRLDTACPRYFAAACAFTGLAQINVGWTDRNSLRVQMSEPSLDWTLTARSTPALSLVNAINRRLPAASWRSGGVVRAREVMARWLGLGSIQLAGTMPSGHVGTLMPQRMYLIDESAATVDGKDFGRPVRLLVNPVIGCFPLPSRGVLVQGGAVWGVLDRIEYARTRAETDSTARWSMV